MKLTVYQFEGTPQELDASEVLRALAGQQSAGAATSALGRETLEGVPGVADEGQETVRGLVRRGPAPDLFIGFLAEATQWPSVGVYGIKRKSHQPGEALDYSRYLRLRKQGSQLGGFAYVYADRSSINLRLSYTERELADMGVRSARVLSTGPLEYRVSVDLTDQRSLDEALRLSRIAYDAT